MNNRALRLVCLMGILALALLRLVYLSADPPLNLTTSGVLYTDEGQYSRNAVHWALTGQWYTPGDFNPAIIYPVATATQMLAFRVLGVSTASARVVTMLFAWLSLYLTYRTCRYYVSAVPALIGVLLLAASYRFYAYSRLALLDIPMITIALASVALAIESARRRSLARAMLAGLAFMCCWWTKLGIYFLPVVVYALWRESHERHDATRLILAWVAVCATLWAIYYVSFALPYRADYQYLIGDVFGRVRPGALMVIRSTAAAAYHALQADPILAVAVTGGAALLLFTNPSFRSSPLLGLAIVWTLCRIVSLGTTPYQPPRYFLPIHFSLAMAAACVIQHLRWPEDGWTGRPLLAVLLGVSLALNAYAIGSYLSEPRYTFVNMCADIERRVVTEAGQPRPVLMGHIGDSISLETGIQAVNDRLGTSDLRTRVRLYRPTHYVSLGPVTNEVAQALEEMGKPSLLSQYDVYGNYYTRQPVHLYVLRASP